MRFPPPPSLLASDRCVPAYDHGTTCWGLLVQCASPEPTQAAAALGAVCQRYRPVVLAHVLGRVASAHDAEDLTQGFFAFVLEHELFLRADPARGRFRAFLFTCLQRYLNGEAERQGAIKRGGNVVMLPLSEEMKEGRGRIAQIADPAHVRRRREEARFDRHWAETLLDGVLDELEVECKQTHAADAFKHLAPFLPGGTGENSKGAHDRAAEALGLSLAAFRGVLHRQRGRYKVLLRAAVVQTLAGAGVGEIEAELRHLAAALAAGGE